MLPSALLRALERDADLAVETPPMRRTTRDWLVDSLCFFLSLVLGGLLLFGAVDMAVRPHSDEFVFVDAIAGLLASVALWWRRRWPIAITIVTTVLGAFFSATGAAGMIALFTVAVHRRLAPTLTLAIATLPASLLYSWLNPQRESPFIVELIVAVVLPSAVVAWGLFVQARRRLLLSLLDRAERAEAEQRLLADQARRAERTRIAREMHDVLAHRVSLIALQAGGLEMRPDLPTDTVRETAGVIRGTARQALEELRSVIGVLREENGADEEPLAPQPMLADVPRLVSESSRAGMHVDLDMQVDHVEDAPASLGRDAYRIVQEALTNVSKHARGTATRVSVRGGPDSGLRIRVVNRLPLGGAPDAPLPGSGAGLLGLRERVSLAGGTLEHGATDTGDFLVEADLVWATTEGSG